MGTRNITRVTADSEVRINQYCQWDGYPTGRGRDVLKFLRDTVSSGETERLRSLVLSSKLINTTEAQKTGNCTYTGAPYCDAVCEVGKLIREYGGYDSGLTPPDTVEKLLAEGKISLQDATYYLTASRDMGNDVLPFMLKHGIKGMTFYTDDYLSNMPPKGDWQIEGMFLVDMDRETAQVWWHGKGSEFTFSEIAGMTDNDIEEKMTALEKAEQAESEDNTIGGMKL